LDVIAEGVETIEQVTELRRLGVRHAQGYFWSLPLPPERVPAWLENHPAPASHPVAGTPVAAQPAP
jgi:sensor c-di-GMP phosphodiesterase-like protein